MGKTYNLLLYFLLIVFFFGMSLFLKRPFIWIGFFIMITSTLRSYDKNDKIEKLLIFYCSFVLLSCIYSWIFNEQPLIKAIESSYHYFGVLFYFVVKRINPSLDNAMKFLNTIMIITTICYVVQWIVYPTVIFDGAINEFDVNDYAFRMRFYCSFLFYLMFLYGINRYAKDHKLAYLAYSVAGLLPIIIMGFRSLIAMTILSMLLTFISVTKQKVSSYLKYIVIGSILIYGSLQVPIVQEKIDEMSKRQESEQTFNNEDYIRNLALAYYSAEFSSDMSMWIFGGGPPQVGTDDSPKNNYQRIFTNAYSLHMYWNDLGIIGLSYLIGIISVLLLVYLCIITMYKCKDKELQFIRFGIFCVLVSTIITSMELYRYGNLVVFGLLLYIVQKKNSNLKLKQIRH